ncbi:MAG: radical SAM protein [Bacteroidales bacterium]|nr:radical SAM protein [Bacteroidales bacterium]
MAVVIFKAIEKCNSNCIYCDVIKKHQDKIMDYDLLKLIFIRMNEYLLDNHDKNITFTWHGGEVCLLGAEYFKIALDIQNEFCPTTKSRIKHQVQSNLTIINQEIINVFKELGINQIGTSFEPIPKIRGFGIKRDSKAYNHKFMEGIRLLAKNEIRWGVIYVVHKKSLEIPLEIFYYLTNLNINSSPNFNQIKTFGDYKHNLGITGEEFADFLGVIFPVWFKNIDRYPNIQPFARLMRNVRDKEMSLLCETSGECNYEWLYIGPEGQTSQCGRSGDYNVLSYGNLNDYTFEQILNNNNRDLLTDRQSVLPKTDCIDCRFWGICHGGCPLDAYMVNHDFKHKSPSCDALKIFMEKYFEPVTGLYADFMPVKQTISKINIQ